MWELTSNATMPYQLSYVLDFFGGKKIGPYASLLGYSVSVAHDAFDCGTAPQYMW